MGLTHNVMPSIYINNMGIGNNKMSMLMKMTETIGLDLEQILYDEFVAEEGSVAQAIASINQTVPLSDIIVDGGIDCDAFQLIIDLAKLNYEQTDEGETLKPIEKQISSDDFLKTLKLVLYDNTEYLEEIKDSEYNYKNVSFKRTPSGELDLSSGEPVIESQGKQYYVVDGNDLDELLSDYEKLLISRFSNGYGLKDSYDVESIIETFMGDEFTTETALEMFDTQKIKQIIMGSARGVYITDKMIAALFAKMLPSLLEETEMGISADSVGIEYIYLEQTEENSDLHHILNIGLNINIHKLVQSMSEEEFVNELIQNLIRETIIIEAGIDITLNLDADDYLTTELAFNGLSIAAVEKLLLAFDALGTDDEGHSITLGDMIGEMLAPVRDMISNLGNTLPGLALEESTLKLPDVYVAIAKMVNAEKAEGDEGYVSPSTIQSALRLFVADGPIADSSSEYYFFREENIVNVTEYNAANERALLSELGAKYGLNFTIDSREYSLAEVLCVLGIGSLEDPSVIEGLQLYDFISPEQLSQIVLTEGDWQNSLKVNVVNSPIVENSTNSDMLTALVKKAVFGGSVDFSMLGDSFGEDDLLFVKLSKEGEKQYLTITIKVVIKEMLPAIGDEAIDQFITDLLPSSAAIFSLKVDISESTSHDDSVIIINENQQASEAVFDLLDSFGANLDLNMIGDSVRSAFDGIKEVVDVQFGDGELLLPNVFELIDEMLLGELYGDGGASIKTALKLIVSDGPIVDSSSEYYFYREGNESAINAYNAANESALLSEFSSKYAFNYTVGGREYSLAEVLGVLGIVSLEDSSAIEGLELYDFIDANRLEELAFVEGSWQSSLKADITNVPRVENSANSDMLTALIKTVVFNGTIDFGMLGDSFGEDDLLFVKLSEEGGKQYLTITVKVIISDILPDLGEDGLQNLITGLLPSAAATVSLKVDITESATVYDDSEIVINLDGERTDALFDLIDKLGASFDLSSIGDSVRSAFDQFRGVIDVELGDSEMLLPNIFDIINKILLEQMYDDGSEIKAVLKGIYTTSETIPLGEALTRRQAFESTLQGTRPKADYNDFLDDFKVKYFITGAAATATSFVELYSYIDVENFRATDINVRGVNGLAYTTKTIEELTPSISLGDLGAIFAKNVSEFGDDIEIYSLLIDGHNLVLNASLPIAMAMGESDEMSKLITVQQIYVRVIVNIDPTNVLISDGEKYYHCELAINDMGSAQDTLFEIAQFFTGSVQDMAEIEFELGKVIHDAISTLDDSFGEGNYDIHDDGIVLRDIFTFLKMNIIGESDQFSSEYIKEAIQGMYAHVDGIDNDSNYKVSDVVSNQISPIGSAQTQEQLVMALVMGGSVLDKDIGAYVAASVGADVGQVVQLNIMAPNATASSRQSVDRNRYSTIIGSQLDNDKTYVAMTVIMNIDKFGGDEDDMHGNSFVLLSDKMYITFIFEFVDGEFNYVDFAINNMDKLHKDTLFALTGLNIDDVVSNIVSESSDCLAPINDLFVSLDTAAGALGRTVTHTFGEADLIDDYAHGTYSCIA
ncbi:MAG: hypothetical protein IKC35_02125 [Clostridia bacterium]|nr:hypothetical protein [Clostridia bacterium]